MEPQQYSIEIRRPVAEVFAYMDDVHREHEWQPNLREAEQTPSGATAVGSRKRYVSDFMGKRVENTHEVVALETGRRVVYRTTPDSSIDATTEVRCDPVGDGTRVTMSVQGKPTGVLRFVPKKMMDKVYQQELAASLKQLKACLEG